jgi:predicted MFS family arabinose efflux permease
LPTLVGEEHLASANALNSLNDNIARLIGPAIGGMLLAAGGFTVVVLLDSLSYLITAVLITLVIVERKPKVVETIEAASSNWLKVWQEWLTGLKLVRGKAILSNLFLIVGLALFGDAILSAILVIFVQDTMGLGSTEFGWMMTAWGIGGLIGGLLIGQLGSKLPAGRVIGWGLILSGALILGAVLNLRNLRNL